MPLYEFKCEECSLIQELICSISKRNEPVERKCLDNSEKDCKFVKVEIVKVSEPVFKGTGFYATDYK